MAKRIRVRFIRPWQDLPGLRRKVADSTTRRAGSLDWVFEVGDEITLPQKEVATVRDRMETWGKTADLCQYGYHVVPPSFLEEIREEEGD